MPPALEPKNQILAAAIAPSATRSPVELGRATSLGSVGPRQARSRGSRPARTRRPVERGLEPRADVSTSGSSGTAERSRSAPRRAGSASARRLEHESAGCCGRLAAELVARRATSRAARSRGAPRPARGPRRAARPPRPGRRAWRRQTTPTAWSIASSFVRRPAPRSERRDADRSRRDRLRRARRRAPAPARTTGACGSAATSGSPPCARIQRSYASTAAPSAIASSARRRPSSLVDAEVGEREQLRRGARARAR